MKRLSKREEELRKKALNVSIKEGSANAVSTGVSASYITPFALKLSSSVNSFHIGLLNAFVGLLSPAAQLYGSGFLEKYHRKSIVLYTVFIQAIIWLPLAVLAILAFYNIASQFLVYLLIFFYCILSALGGFHYPAWFSWMGDLVPEKETGKYFARRNIIVGIIELCSGLIAGIILDISSNKGLALFGFATLFVLAFAFRLWSLRLLSKQYIPHIVPKSKYHLSLKEIVRGNKSFKKFALYQAFFNFALMFASPFFAVYMIKQLNFDYFTFMAVSVSSTLFYLLFTPLVGRISDKYGDVKLIWIANIMFVLTPLLWIFIKNPFALIIVPQLVSGLANAAFIISFTNFIFGSLHEEKRGKGVAYANLFAGFGTFIGSIFGGVLLTFFNITFINKFVFIFLVASALRLIVALIFLPGIKDGKKVKRLSPFHIDPLHPIKTFRTDLSWMRNIIK